MKLNLRYSLIISTIVLVLAAANYSLQPSSPLIDAGIHIPGINDDFAGSAPDIGALEAKGTGHVDHRLVSIEQH